MRTFHFGRLSILLGLMLSACSLTPPVDTIDYKSVGEKKSPVLVYPPDLTQPSSEKRYAVAGGSSATLSQYNASTKAKSTSPADSAVTPEQAGMKIERQGDKRWLVVNKSPAELYPQIKSFWEETGFLLVTDSPKTGIMETDWAENRAKIPLDIVRRNIGKVLDSIYSTGERDKFRTRLEPGQGKTEIFVSHRGAVEKLMGSLDANNTTGTMWTDRPSDPELEAEMLARMMVYLGGVSKEQARKEIAATKPEAKSTASRLVVEAGVSTLVLEQSFDRAWREVGLALDRSNFTVEDRDRAQGVYFVRVVDSGSFDSQKKPGFFANLFNFSSKEDDLKKAKRYRILVRSGGAAATRVTVADGEGRPAGDAVAKPVLTILDQQVAR